MTRGAAEGADDGIPAQFLAGMTHGAGTIRQVDYDLFAFWSEAIEVPVVAEGALTEALIAQFGPVTDFFGVGDEIWRSDDPLDALKRLLAPLG